MKFPPLADTLQGVTHAGAVELIAKATEEDLRRVNNSGITGFHMVACLSLLNKLPPKMLTVENLTLRTPEDWTPVHDAAVRGDLDHIPLTVLRSISLVQDIKAQTPLYVAASSRKLQYVPKEIITPFDLHVNQGTGTSTIQGLIKGMQRYNDKPLEFYSDWNTIPKSLLTLQNMTVKTKTDAPITLTYSLLKIMANTMHLHDSISEMVPALSLVGISKMEEQERESWLKAIEELDPPANIHLKDVKIQLRANLAGLETPGSWAEL